jgi:hypothetical protein
MFRRESVHQVDADVAEACLAASLKGFDGLPGGVPAMKQLQGVFLEGLYAHADAVDGECAEHGYVFRGQIVGVGFEGNFGIFPYLIYIIYIAEYGSQLFLREL